jgi:outer membrane protein OmpA-like peptidoglycan-associated protein
VSARRALAAALLAVTVAGLAGCTAAGQQRPAAAGPAVGGPPTSRGPDGRPVSVLAGERAPVSELTEERAGASSVSQVESALSQLGAKRTPEGIVITLPDQVLFDFDKADIRPDAAGVLAQIALVARHYPAAPIKVRGHTDAKGTPTYNLDLSRRRAKAVVGWLAGREHLAAGRMRATGYGEARPVAPNTNPDGSDNPDGRRRNRRVEVIIAA